MRFCQVLYVHVQGEGPDEQFPGIDAGWYKGLGAEVLLQSPHIQVRHPACLSFMTTFSSTTVQSGE
jgi:hypothetical protein